MIESAFGDNWSASSMNAESGPYRTQLYELNRCVDFQPCLRFIRHRHGILRHEPVRY
jgi:hypothetical protein